MGELIVTTLPDKSRMDLYLLVRVGMLLAGMWRALVCAAAVYSVLRR